MITPQYTRAKTQCFRGVIFTQDWGVIAPKSGQPVLDNSGVSYGPTSQNLNLGGHHPNSQDWVIVGVSYPPGLG